MQSPLGTPRASPRRASLGNGLLVAPLSANPFAFLLQLPRALVKVWPLQRAGGEGRGAKRQESRAVPEQKPGQPLSVPDYYPSETGRAHTWGPLHSIRAPRGGKNEFIPLPRLSRGPALSGPCQALKPPQPGPRHYVGGMQEWVSSQAQPAPPWPMGCSLWGEAA